MCNILNTKNVGLALLMLIFLSLYSCKENDYQTINIDLNQARPNVEIVIDNVIPLETDTTSLIGDIERIRIFNNQYYILDKWHARNIFVFDSVGNFISKLAQGNGPGEVIWPIEFLINTLNNSILVYDLITRNLMYYDLHLNHQKSEYFEDLNLSKAEFLTPYHILINSPIINDSIDELSYVNYAIYDLDKKKYISKFFPIKTELVGLTYASPISIVNGRVLFIAPFDNYLYTLENGEYKKAIKMDFGRYNITKADIEMGMDYIFAQARTGQKIIPFQVISENDISLAFSIFSGKVNFIIYTKESGKTIISDTLFENGILPLCKLQYAFGLNKYLAIVQPEDMIRFNNENKIVNEYDERLDELSNPCLIIFSIKEPETPGNS
jgi:hypothetical protein